MVGKVRLYAANFDRKWALNIPIALLVTLTLVYWWCCTNLIYIFFYFLLVLSHVMYRYLDPLPKVHGKTPSRLMYAINFATNGTTALRTPNILVIGSITCRRVLSSSSNLRFVFWKFFCHFIYLLSSVYSS